MLTMFGLLSRLHIKQLRQKVQRGMKGAAQRGTCLGALSLGFTRQVCRDSNGEIIHRPDGRPRHKPCIDPQTAPYRQMLYDLYVNKNWSGHKIAKYFNRLQVDGSTGWTCSSIKNLIKRPDAIGLFVWNRRRREFDYEQDKYVVVDNPRSEWVRYRDPDLVLVSAKLWRAAYKKLRRAGRTDLRTGRKLSRNQRSATTLFSGTLSCAYCGCELTLYRSNGKFKDMHCRNGALAAHGCLLSTSKSTKIIEECLLGHISDFILTQPVIEALVIRANLFLEEEARKPRVDVAPLKTEEKKLAARVKKLVARVENEPDESLCDGYHTRIKELQTELNELRRQIREADRHSQEPPEPLDVDRVLTYLADMRELLNQDTAMAAEAIRTLTGPIQIRQEKIHGARRCRWIASFKLNILCLLQQLAKDRDYAEADVLASIPAVEEPVEVVIDRVPKYERLAPLFKRQRDNGASIQTIAHAHGLSREYTRQILEFADSGKRPNWGSVRRRGTGLGKPAIYPEIADEVVYLREEKKMSFVKIAEKLGVSDNTAHRAYDFARPAGVRKAAEQGTIPWRGRYSHLGEETFQKIRSMLRAGSKPLEIAQELGCSGSTVRRVRQEMQNDDTKDDYAA
ncbi:MAG: hypothetical protein GX594_18975 [Pirellulaceae bacterium]|nr:hypothetical protein [Pirellulaceae bacterium]